MTNVAPKIELLLNGDAFEIAAGASITDLIGLLGLRSELVAVERNGSVVRRAAHAETRIAAGDVIEVVTLVGGG